MSDLWEFKNGVMRIVEMDNLGGRRAQQLLVYQQTEELITSHQMLEDRLRDEGGRELGKQRSVANVGPHENNNTHARSINEKVVQSRGEHRRAEEAIDE
ncbi:hypothetical protein ZIOFF_035111 [Zingiber officinale]|uniref:Uncharacterized protein n=1 Tax=Zingiber officinale TaxID=94328 RepID=A0A8J5KXC6_ZINOF|nr:hypothetical protein ZIOFF_035111 [Zingiber officinale]